MNVYYLLIVFIICLPGVYFMFQSEKIHIKEGDDLTDGQRLIAHLLTALLFSAMGAFFVPKIGVISEFELTKFLFYGLGLGCICSISHIFYYYFYLVPKLAKKEYAEIESYYKNAGIFSRIFYGGVIEEVIFRWGLLSLFIWLFSVLKIHLQVSVWLAIIVSSLLFAIVHLPSIKLVSSQPKKEMYVYAMIGNVWVGVFAGFAFVQSGLGAAIAVHMLFHLLWWPIQKLKSALVFNVD